MRNSLSCCRTIILNEVKAIAVQLLRHLTCHLFRQGKCFLTPVIRQLIKISKMLLRHHEGMSLCRRSKIQDHAEAVVFIQRIGRNLSVRYFTENTSFVSHVYLSFCRPNGNDSHPLPAAGIRSRSLHAPGPLTGKSSHMAQEKGCEKTAQQSSEMRRIIHPHTLKA